MLAYASAVLLASDFQAGGINFTSPSRSALHYLFGKLRSAFLLSAYKLVPAVGLFVEQLFTPPTSNTSRAHHHLGGIHRL
jgi:hypothetical protein